MTKEKVNQGPIKDGRGKGVGQPGGGRRCENTGDCPVDGPGQGQGDGRGKGVRRDKD